MMTDEPALHLDVAEIISEMSVDNPTPAEQWKARGFWDPQFKLAAIDRAERAGVIETRGDRGSDGYEFRFTPYGRLIANGGTTCDGFSDGMAAMERLVASGNQDAAIVSNLLASLLGEIASLRSGTKSASASVTAPSAVTGRLLEALEECAGYTAGPYFWREKSMSRLVSLGLVETWNPKKSAGKRLAYRVTDAGRAFLDGLVS